MRDKHIHVPSESALLKKIYKTVDEELTQDRKSFSLGLILKFSFYACLAGLSYSALFLVNQPWIFILAFVVFGFAILLLAFNFAHDFSHDTVFKSKALNNLGYTFVYTLNGAHAEAWKMRHIHSHHYAPNVEEYDSDLQISSLIRVVPDSQHRWFHKYQHFYAPLAYTTYSLFWVFVKDFVILFGSDDFNKKKDLAYYLSFILQKGFYITYLLVLPLVLSPQPWFIVIAAFLIMHLLQSLFLLFTFFMTHHVEDTSYFTVDKNGFINSSWLMNQVRSSNDMYPFSNVANFIFGGFNNHIAHHLFPHVHHYYYPELNKILYKLLKAEGIIPNETSYFGGVASHLKHLRRMGHGHKELALAQS